MERVELEFDDQELEVYFGNSYRRFENRLHYNLLHELYKKHPAFTSIDELLVAGRLQTRSSLQRVFQELRKYLGARFPYDIKVVQGKGYTLVKRWN